MGTLVIRLDAGNDRNGNPRRVYVAFNPAGDIVGTQDEGYLGSAAATRRWPKAKLGPTFATTPAEYRELVKRDDDTKRMMRGGSPRRKGGA